MKVDREDFDNACSVLGSANTLNTNLTSIAFVVRTAYAREQNMSARTLADFRAMYRQWSGKELIS